LKISELANQRELKGMRLFFARRRRYDDLAVSIEEHIALKAEELVAEGVAPDEARRRARVAFGNVTAMRERSREVWQWGWVERAWGELRLVLRRVRKAPGFALTVLLTLAIGMGANTAVFNVVETVMVKPLPYPESGRLVSLWMDAPGAGGLANFHNGLLLSPSMYFTFADHNRTLESMGVWLPQTANVTGVGAPEQVKAVLVTAGVLEALQVAPEAGRWLNASDQDPHGAKAVMLSYAYWQRRFGRDRGVVGRSIEVDSVTREVVGVMPRGFRMMDQDFDMLAPLAFDRSKTILAEFGFEGIGRLKPGATVQEANADLSRLIPVWMDSWTNGPGTNPHYYERWRITPNLRPLKEKVVGDVGSALWVVMATVGLVMLIACANLANLMLVRAEARQQELAVRAALGAGRARIARELLLESLVLGLMGGAAAIGVAWAGLRLLVRIGPAELPRLSEIGLDGRTLGFTFLVAVISGLLFGSIPALKYARVRSSTMLGSGERTASAGRAKLRSRNVLVVAQVAMALVLLVSALLMIRTFAALRNVDPGFADAAHVETVSVTIPSAMVKEPRGIAEMQRAILEQLGAIPSVNSAGFAADVPMDASDPNWDELAVEGKHYEGGEPPLMLFNYISPGYFRTMGTRLVAGRDFTWSDLEEVRPVLVVSESFARNAWGSAAAAIGKRVKKYQNSPWQEVIGVMEDVRAHGVNETAPPIIYWPAMFYDRFWTTPAMDGLPSVTYVVHSSRAGTEGLLDQMQQAVWQVNANLPLANVGTMQVLYGKSMARTSFTLVMLGIAGAMALGLGVIGIYGVISYAVSRRTREIGIRVALGAQKRELEWMFVRSALALTGIGVAVGVAASAGLMQWMRALLYGISPLDPLTYVTVPVALGVAALAASYLPARRAAAVDPVEALRRE
jgi:predicted permease